MTKELSLGWMLDHHQSGCAAAAAAAAAWSAVAATAACEIGEMHLQPRDG